MARSHAGYAVPVRGLDRTGTEFCHRAFRLYAFLNRERTSFDQASLAGMEADCARGGQLPGAFVADAILFRSNASFWSGRALVLRSTAHEDSPYTLVGPSR